MINVKDGLYNYFVMSWGLFWLLELVTILMESVIVIALFSEEIDSKSVSLRKLVLSMVLANLSSAFLGMMVYSMLM